MKSVLQSAILGMAAAGFAASIGIASAQTTDPMMGSWKMNVEKSRFPFGPPPKSATLRFQPDGKGVKVIVEGVNASGAANTVEWSGAYDGKDYPLKGAPQADTASFKRVNARTVRQTNKKGGELVGTQTRELSRDGKTITSTNALFGGSVADLAAGGDPAQTKNPLIGTWNLNIGKWKFTNPPPKSQTTRIEAVGKGIKTTIEGISAAGSPTATQYTAYYDGRDYPIKGSQLFDTVALKRVDARTENLTLKKGGEVVQTVVRKVSKDGKTLTSTATSYTRVVFEKQ